MDGSLVGRAFLSSDKFPRTARKIREPATATTLTSAGPEAREEVEQLEYGPGMFLRRAPLATMWARRGSAKLEAASSAREQ